MLTSAKIALVTLVQSSVDDQSRSSELVDKLREDLQSSGLSRTWSIEKITILEETSLTTKMVRTPREEHLTVP